MKLSWTSGTPKCLLFQFPYRLVVFCSWNPNRSKKIFYLYNGFMDWWFGVCTSWLLWCWEQASLILTEIIHVSVGADRLIAGVLCSLFMWLFTPQELIAWWWFTSPKGRSGNMQGFCYKVVPVFVFWPEQVASPDSRTKKIIHQFLMNFKSRWEFVVFFLF